MPEILKKAINLVIGFIVFALGGAILKITWGIPRYYIIIGLSLLIIYLIYILVYINRKKSN